MAEMLSLKVRMQIMSAVDFIKSYAKFVDARRIMNILCRKPLTCGIGGLRNDEAGAD